MTTLPRTLAPWAKELSIFPEETALALAGMASRLAGVLGAVGGAAASDGTPDGFSGISRRGTYERLLASEWLLQEELPDEFVRRVVASEHSFLESAYAREAAVRRTVVLFDSGASQLGGPRLVHLAALVVLAQRADRTGSTLVWGALQDATSTLHVGLSETGITALLRSRARAGATRAAIERWMACVRAAVVSELWMVGPRTLGEAAARNGASLLAVTEVLDAEGPSRVLVETTSSGNVRPRSATLELPPARVAVQTLRDPFAAAVAPRQATSVRPDPTSSIVFAIDGRRLYVRGSAGSLVTFQIPNSPRATIGPPAVFVPPPGERVVAVGHGMKGKRTVVVTAATRAVVLHVLSKRGTSVGRTQRYAIPDDYAPSPVAEILPLAVFESEHAGYVDAEGMVVELKRLNGGPAALVWRGDAHARTCLPLRNGLVYLQSVNEPEPGKRAWPPKLAVVAVPLAGPNTWQLDTHALDLQGANKEACVFSFVHSRDPLRSLVVCVKRAASWMIQRAAAAPSQRDRWATIACPEDHTLVAAIERTGQDAPHFFWSIVTLDATRTRLELRDIHHTETLVTSPSRIAHASVSCAAPLIAFHTESGELFIYSYSLKTILYRAAPGAAS